jgi:lipid-binding SYLF domain-containing protein
MNKKVVDNFLKGKTKLGRDASVAAGPGAAAGSVGGDVLTYARTSGAFAGVSLGGAGFSPDNDANQRLYDKVVDASQIASGSVQATTAGQAFAPLLDSKAGSHSMRNGRFRELAAAGLWASQSTALGPCHQL